MAEQEVIKHTKKVYKIWRSKEHSLWSKVKEFLIEIIIIVFAVTLSIWLHERSEHSHQQKIVKEFLLGLKSDLSKDVSEMKQDQENYLRSKKAFSYLNNIKKEEALNRDSLRLYQGGIFMLSQLIPNDGRYEGFKSSGKIGDIENAVLQHDIVDFYQEDIKTLVLTTTYYSSRKDKFFDYFIRNLKKETDSTTNIGAVLLSDEGQNHSRALGVIDEIVDRYDSCINKARKIIAEIEKEYH